MESLRLHHLGMVVVLTLAVATAAWGQDKPSKEAGGISLKPGETTATEGTEKGPEDPMEDRQSFNTYTSLEDGQPGQPGEFQINYSNGWETSSGASDPWLMNMEIQYTFDNPALRNTKLGLAVPLELMNGGVDGNGDINFEWYQRWVEEQECGGWWPTLSTVNVIRIPSGYHSEKVDWTLTGVVAKEAGPGTAYMNAFIKSANGDNNLETGSWSEQLFQGEEGEDLRNFQWGFRWGYKWRMTEQLALIADYVHQSSELRGNHNQNIGEVSMEWRVNDHLTIGPGIMFGLDGAEETPNFGAGVLLHYSIE